MCPTSSKSDMLTSKERDEIMLIIFGANGRTGIEIVKEAIRRKTKFKAIARNDHDTHRLERILSVNKIDFADADHPESIRAVLSEATAVVSCLDSRTAGFGSPKYSPEAAANVVRTAGEMNIGRILHLSVMGAYRWSPNPLNKQSFHLDIHIRRLRVPWTMLRVSCFHDEIIEGHVSPPDQGRPHKIHPSSRYSPVSRRDVARVVCNILPDLIANRTWLLGGPKVYHGKQLQKTIAPFLQKGSKRTKYGPLPNGDFSVAPETSEVMVGWIPTESLEWSLDPKNHPIKESTAPFWKRPAPLKHQSDQGKNDSLLKSIPDSLRFALHQTLFSDLPRLDIQDTDDIQLDFSKASWVAESPKEIVLQAQFQSIKNIQIYRNGNLLTQGTIDFLFDDLADSFHSWWVTDQGLPKDIWDQLDLGIKRRLSKHAKWNKELIVREFLATSHERVRL